MITSPSAPTKGRMVATLIATIALGLSACAGGSSEQVSTAEASGPAPTQQAAASDAPSEEPATFAPAGNLRAGELGAPAANGLIAYSSDGDIFVGDPVTGTSTAIVTGPSNDTRPIFSPDGLRIAFLRAESLSDGTIVVVRADGSRERVVTTEALTNGIPAFAWTPDSTSLVLNHDSRSRATTYFDGLLSLVDASGVAEPRLITPPLKAEIGYTYFSIHDPVAPMFRPPNGDELVGEVDGAISVVDIDGTHIEGFVTPDLTEFEPYYIEGLAWSRDGSMISFRAYSNSTLVPFEAFGLFVMDADGSDLRRFETELLDRAWSPDGSKIALEKPVTMSGSASWVIAILDLETGAERVLEATSAVVKDMADRATDPDAFRTYSIRTEHEYAYEGWSWTPDGRGIVVLERHETRPFVVDIETGQVTELPWVVDGAVSWQRVPVD